MTTKTRENDRPPFPKEQFARVDTENGDPYFPTFDSKIDAADDYEDDEGWVATYKLVKVEKLRLDRRTEVVKVGA